MKKGILLILVLGIFYRLITTINGNFLFHQDSARDMVDVREMVVLGKPRLTGPNTAISGLYDGPAWYYLLSIPFVLSGGDPYAVLIMQFILWAVGGYFLLRIVWGWSKNLIFPIGFLWIASNYMTLATQYSFNPNPVILLTPLFIYVFAKFIETKQFAFGAFSFILAGLFFNFEMSFGIFLPVVILVSILLKNPAILKRKSFYMGLGLFTLFLIPQIFFDFKHQGIMSQALIAHIDREQGKLLFAQHFKDMFYSFYNLSVPLFLNREFLSALLLLFSIPVFIKFYKGAKKDTYVLISLMFVLIPFTGYLFLPITVTPWHLGGSIIALIILTAFILKEIWNLNFFGKVTSFVISFFILYFSLANIFNFFLNDFNKPSKDPSLFGNETRAIDYVYQQAAGKNFKVYIYLPSVYDYPYQYLFWWYGKKKYGYLPVDYAYAPNKPEYIANKESFSASGDSIKSRSDSNLVFLIKEPNYKYTRYGWEGEFVKLKSLSKEMVGPIEIETMKE